jgi:hypothetical protein
MVFVIQHTQAREWAATQRELDEIVQALHGADAIRYSNAVDHMCLTWPPFRYDLASSVAVAVA